MLQLVALEKPFNDQVRAYSQAHADRLREYKISPIKEGDVNPETIGEFSWYNDYQFLWSLFDFQIGVYLSLQVLIGNFLVYLCVYFILVYRVDSSLHLSLCLQKLQSGPTSQSR